MQVGVVDIYRGTAGLKALAINDPSAFDVISAWNVMSDCNKLSDLPAFMRRRKDWVDYFWALEWRPVIIFSPDTPAAVIWFTNIEPAYKTAHVHFVATGDFNVLGVYRRASQVINDVLRSDKVNILYASFDEPTPKGERMARSFGFTEYARVAGCVYCMITK